MRGARIPRWARCSAPALSHFRTFACASGAGPMRPPDDRRRIRTSPASGPTVRPEEPLMPQRKQLFGFWRLNVDESDDAHEKLKEASNDGNVASPRGGGGGNGGGGGGQPGGIHIGGMGSPFPGGGGGGGGSSRRSGNNGTDSELDRAQMQELLNPAGSLTVALKDPAAAADTKGRRRKTTADSNGYDECRPGGAAEGSEQRGN